MVSVAVILRRVRSLCSVFRLGQRLHIMTSTKSVSTSSTINMETPARAYWALAIGILCISFSAIFVRWANAPGAVNGFYRMAIAMIVLAWPFLRHVRRTGLPLRREILIAMAAGIFFGCDLIFWNTGIVLSGAATPTLMANTAPLWVGLGALFIFHEKLNRFFWLGLGLAMIGAASILGADLSGDMGVGALFGLVAAIFYAGYMLIMQRSRQRLDALPAFWLAGVSATAVLLVTALVRQEPLTGYSLTTWLNFLALGLLTQVLGQFLVSYSLGALPASLVSPTLLAQPALTAILAIPLLGEIPTSLHVLGAVALIVGVYMVHRSRG